MNLFSVNGGPLNGGSRLALVAAAAAIACSSLVAAVAVRAQEALSPVYSGARITAAPTLQQAANAGVGGTSFLAARPKHTAAASAKFDAAVDLRGFVFRGVEAKAKFVSGADFLAIPASVLGVAKANPCSATVEAVATKRQPGKSGVSPAGVSIVADSVATRGAVATTAAGLGAFYAETAINGVGEAYGRVTPSAQVVATGLVTRPARAAVSAGADCQVVGAHVVHGRASVASGGYDVFAAPHVIARGSSGMAGSAELVAAPKRELRPRAAGGGTAGLVASTKTNHGSAAVAVQGAVVLTAKADRRTAAASNALASAKLNPVALRTVKPAVLVAVDSTVNTVAQRRVFASAAYGSAACAFAAFPDTTVREGGALLTAGVALQSTPVVTRYVAAYSGCGADVDADPTRTVEPAASASTLADFSAQALLTATYSRADDLYSTADFAAQPDVTVRMADVAVQATAGVDAAPYVTRYGDGVVPTSADLKAVGTRVVQPQALAEAGSDATADAIRCLLPEANTGFGTAEFAAHPDVTVRNAASTAVTTADAWVEPQVTRHVDSLVSTSAGFEGFASRTVQPKAMVDASASTVAGAIRVLLGGVDVGFGVADFAAQPDVTVRMADVAVQATAGVDAAPYVTRYGDGVVPTSADLKAVGTRVVQPQALAEAGSDATADAIRCLLPEANTGFGTSELAAHPDVTVRNAASTAVTTADAWVEPQVTRHVDSLVSTGAGFEGFASRAVQPKAMVDASASTVAGAIRVLLGGADVGFGDADFSAQPDTTVRDSAAGVVAGSDLAVVPKVTRPGHSICWADSSIEAKPTRLAYPESTANTEASVVVDATRVVAGESWTLVPWCWFEVVPDVTVRQASSQMEVLHVLDAVGTVVKEASAHAVTLTDINPTAVRVLVPAASITTRADFEADPKRTAKAAAATSCVAFFSAAADVTIREAGAVADSVGLVQAHPVVCHAGGATVAAQASVAANAARMVLPQANGGGVAGADVQALRVLEAESWALVPWCWFEVVPDVTVREGGAVADSRCLVSASGTVVKVAGTQAKAFSDFSAQAVRVLLPGAAFKSSATASALSVRGVRASAHTSSTANLQATPDVTVRQATASSSSSVVAIAKATVKHSAQVQWVSTATVVAAPVVKKLAQSALGAGAVFSGRAVRSVWATAKQDTGRAFFAAAPDVTVRKGAAVASTSANLFANALVDRPAIVALATTAVVHANPAIYRAGNADIYCEVYLRVAPIANLFSFDPDNRTFYRQATTTNFVRNAPITEFRRPA